MRESYDTNFENQFYNDIETKGDFYDPDVKDRSPRRRSKRKRRRRRNSGCLSGCGTCILPLLLCCVLLFVFRDRYPVALLLEFLPNPIHNAALDPIPDGYENASTVSVDSQQVETGIPVEVFQGGDSLEDPSGNDVAIPNAAEEIFDGFCYRTMSLEQRLIYEQLYEGISAEAQEFQIDAKESGDIGYVLNCILADNPEFFWLDGAASIYGFENRPRKKITLEFNCDPEDIDSLREQIEAEADRYLQELSADASDYEKVKKAYEFVINNVSYDIYADQSQNLVSSMINHTSVCAGYSKELQYLLHEAGVECAYITGTVSRNGELESHAWNLVNIDGTDTFVDVTWGDPSYVMSSEAARELPDISYNYLCLTTEEMERTGHTPDDSYTLPECTSYEYDYYIQSGRYYEYCDTDAIRMQIRNAVDNNIADVHMKFATLEDYYEAKIEIFDGGMLSDELQNRMKWDGLTTITYFPLTNDDLRTIEILW